MKTRRRIAKAIARGGAKALAAVMCASLAAAMLPAGGLAAKAYAAGASDAAANAASTKELSEEPVSLQPGESANGVRLRTVDELREQASSGAIAELVEQERKTDEEAAADAAALASENGFGNGSENGSGSGATALPSKLDLRERGIVSSVKNQSPWGDCWAFAANAAAETSLASAIAQRTGQAPKALDCAALQTAWFAYTPLSEDASTLSGTAASQAGEGATPKSAETNRLNMGGTALLSASCFMQGIGVSWLADTPYENAAGTREADGDWSLSEEKRFASIARLKKVNYLDFLHTASWGLDESAMAAAKAELNAGRGLVVAYRASDTPDNTMNYANWCQYNDFTESDQTSTNHLVCIVGYDDDYSAANFNEGHRPPGNGAFLVKNSWGSINSTGDDYLDWGIEGSGYFWLSYYDHSIYRPCSFEFDLESYTGGYIDTGAELVDQYDYMQALDVPQTTFFPDSSDGWYSNVYTASEKEAIHHVGTYYFSGCNLRYRVYKLKDGATTPDDYVSEVPDAQGTYTADSSGYVSIELDKQVQVKEGGKYAVWFSQVDGNNVSYLPRGTSADASAGFNFTATAVINEGESFSTASTSKAWRQLSSRAGHDPGDVSDNYCVKAYATVLPDATGADAWTRLAGNTAIGTMKQVVNEGWSSSEWAIVATNKSYHDALAASGLAGLLDAPVLLTAPDSLTPATKALIEAKGVKKVVVVGGPEAVSEAAFEQIEAIDGVSAERVWGNTAVGTANKIYDYGKSLNGGWGGDAIVATVGSYQDAASIAPFAYAKHAPVFLTGAALSSDTSSRVAAAGAFERTLVIGGTEAVSADVEKQLVEPTRLGGNTAYGTCKKVADFCLENGMTAAHMGVATGRSYQDAIVGAALCGKNNSVMVLADDKNSANVDSVIAAHKDALVENCYIFGGEQAVSAAVEKEIVDATK